MASYVVKANSAVPVASSGDKQQHGPTVAAVSPSLHAKSRQHAKREAKSSDPKVQEKIEYGPESVMGKLITEHWANNRTLSLCVEASKAMTGDDYLSSLNPTAVCLKMKAAVENILGGKEEMGEVAIEVKADRRTNPNDRAIVKFIYHVHGMTALQSEYLKKELNQKSLGVLPVIIEGRGTVYFNHFAGQPSDTQVILNIQSRMTCKMVYEFLKEQGLQPKLVAKVSNGKVTEVETQMEGSITLGPFTKTLGAKSTIIAVVAPPGRMGHARITLGSIGFQLNVKGQGDCVGIRINRYRCFVPPRVSAIANDAVPTAKRARGWEKPATPSPPVVPTPTPPTNPSSTAVDISYTGSVHEREVVADANTPVDVSNAHSSLVAQVSNTEKHETGTSDDAPMNPAPALVGVEGEADLLMGGGAPANPAQRAGGESQSTGSTPIVIAHELPEDMTDSYVTPVKSTRVNDEADRSSTPLTAEPVNAKKARTSTELENVEEEVKSLQAAIDEAQLGDAKDEMGDVARMRNELEDKLKTLLQLVKDRIKESNQARTPPRSRDCSGGVRKAAIAQAEVEKAKWAERECEIIKALDKVAADMKAMDEVVAPQETEAVALGMPAAEGNIVEVEEETVKALDFEEDFQPCKAKKKSDKAKTAKETSLKPKQTVAQKVFYVTKKPWVKPATEEFTLKMVEEEEGAVVDAAKDNSDE